MVLGDRLQRWWDRVRGYEQAAAKPLTTSPRVGPLGARPVRTVMGNAPDGSMKLSVESKRPQDGPTRARVRDAGFNPYENTGGYRKPRGWDGVQRK